MSNTNKQGIDLMYQACKNAIEIIEDSWDGESILERNDFDCLIALRGTVSLADSIGLENENAAPGLDSILRSMIGVALASLRDGYGDRQIDAGDDQAANVLMAALTQADALVEGGEKAGSQDRPRG